MSTNRYLDYQRDYMTSGALNRLAHPLKLTLANLPKTILATMLSHALPDRRDGFIPSILNTAKMFKKTSTARFAPKFLLVNKRFLHIGKQVWLQTDFSHVYINSWAPLHKGLISSASTISFVCLTLDIRRGERALNEKLVPSAFGKKLRELLHDMQNLEVLLVRVWHGIGSLGPVSEIIMNNLAGVRVAQAVNVASIVSTERGFDQDRGCPGLLSDFYVTNFVSHLLHLPLKEIPEPKTVYLDESEPLLRIPIWRGCAAARAGADGNWMPAVMAKQSEEETEVRSTEDDEVLNKLFKARMKEIPWVKAAARAGKRKQKAQKKKGTEEEKMGEL
ncbi:hypothetical protein QM012_005535 [Aureobasidium pullulans]|uniref:Uncharacterized protein n=1 Tax=Aureobasidium pullulans TaxID=5580 RepID=A0ABR0T5T6_AURPU